MAHTVDSKNSYPGTTKKEIWSWCFYDFANSSFTTIIVTVSYSVYFTQIVAKGYNPELWWGWGYGISMLVVGVISPILGAVADYSGIKKTLLIFFSLLCIMATSLLVFVHEGDIWMGISLFIMVFVAFRDFNATTIAYIDKSKKW